MLSTVAWCNRRSSDAGGRIVAAGTPEEVARLDYPTGRALAEAFLRAKGN